METGDWVFAGFMIFFGFSLFALIAFLIVRWKQAKDSDILWDMGCLDYVYYTTNEYLPGEAEQFPSIRSVYNKLIDSENPPKVYLHSLSNGWGTRMIETNDVYELMDVVKDLTYDTYCEVVFKPGVRFTFRKGDDTIKECGE